MLPPPPVRIPGRPPVGTASRRSLRDWLALVDSYTLWAFNPHPSRRP